MNQQMNEPNMAKSKRSPLIYVLIAMLVVLAVLVSVVVALIVPSCQKEEVEQPTIIVESEEEPEEAVEESTTMVMTAEMMEAEQAVQEIVAPYGESVAVSVEPIDDTLGFSINGDEQFIAASMIKLPVLAMYMKSVDEGIIESDATYALESNDIVGGAGVVGGYAPGTPIPYETLAKYMIMYSDNTATNILIDSMGKETINANNRDLGLENTKLNRRMMRMNEGSENQITANDCAWILREIAQGELVSVETSATAQEFLLAQDDKLGLIEGLPAEVRFGHKTGSLSTVRHDGGIVYALDPYVIVVLTSLDEGEANDLMSRISATVYEHLG